MRNTKGRFTTITRWLWKDYLRLKNKQVWFFTGGSGFFLNIGYYKLKAGVKISAFLFYIYNSTIFTDIVKRNKIRKIDQLERIIKFAFDNIGRTFSAASISKYLKSERRTIDNETVYSYLSKLESAFILHRCSRYDLQGKEILKTQEKFYVADPAMRYSVLGYPPDSVAAMLENVVYLELLRRGYEVYIGQLTDGEIDFVATRGGDKLYVQVTQEITSKKTEHREYDRLLIVRDNYPKYVLRTDEFAGGNYEGIKSMHVADFLLSDEYWFSMWETSCRILDDGRRLRYNILNKTAGNWAQSSRPGES